MPRNQDVVNIVQKTDRDIDKKYNYCRIMYIVIRITPLVCLYIHECHMPITPYFFYAQKDLAQRLTNTLCISIGNIYIYIELDERMRNKQTLVGKTQ